jgi:hypothetical protein
MSYRGNRAAGFQPWGVTNPWVYADLSQPQRLRGQVSPMIFKTHPPSYGNRTLPSGVGDVDPIEARGQRMERYAIAGVTLSAISVGLVLWNSGALKKVVRNRRRR